MLNNITANDTRPNAFGKLILHFNIATFLEVGVRDGMFGRELLSQNANLKYIGIDNDDSSNNLRNFLSDYHDRCTFIKDTSPSCAAKFDDGSLDCVYLDDCHTFEHVTAELPIWYKKVKIGGIFAGHDFLNCNITHEGSFGVMQAVLDFTERYDIQFYVTGCTGMTREELRCCGERMGEELVKAHNRQPHNLIDVPSWWMIKEKEI